MVRVRSGGGVGAAGAGASRVRSLGRAEVPSPLSGVPWAGRRRGPSGRGIAGRDLEGAAGRAGGCVQGRRAGSAESAGCAHHAVSGIAGRSGADARLAGARPVVASAVAGQGSPARPPGLAGGSVGRAGPVPRGVLLGRPRAGGRQDARLCAGSGGGGGGGGWHAPGEPKRVRRREWRPSAGAALRPSAGAALRPPTDGEAWGLVVSSLRPPEIARLGRLSELLRQVPEYRQAGGIRPPLATSFSSALAAKRVGGGDNRGVRSSSAPGAPGRGAGVLASESGALCRAVANLVSRVRS